MSNGAAGELLFAARRLLDAGRGSLAHRRGAAVLARQAIEIVARQAMGTADARALRWKTRFLVLSHFFPEVQPRRGHFLWETWSQISHFHHYDLVPDDAAIAARLTETARWVRDATEALRSPPARLHRPSPR